jgi:hypothetical protein
VEKLRRQDEKRFQKVTDVPMRRVWRCHDRGRSDGARAPYRTPSDSEWAPRALPNPERQRVGAARLTEPERQHTPRPGSNYRQPEPAHYQKRNQNLKLDSASASDIPSTKFARPAHLILGKGI